jgi:hypothetical protein
MVNTEAFLHHLTSVLLSVRYLHVKLWTVSCTVINFSVLQFVMNTEAQISIVHNLADWWWSNVILEVYSKAIQFVSWFGNKLSWLRLFLVLYEHATSTFKLAMTAYFQNPSITIFMTIFHSVQSYINYASKRVCSPRNIQFRYCEWQNKHKEFDYLSCVPLSITHSYGTQPDILLLCS